MWTWPDVEAALRARPRWRRIGREWHGPCPVQGIGENTCWFAEGARSPVRGGCRKCGGRLSAQGFREHLAVIMGDQVSTSEHLTSMTSTSTPTPTPPSTAPAEVWGAGVDPAGTPGWRYLVERRRLWSPSRRLPPSVRWLPRGTAAVRNLFPLPDWAAGVLLYRYAAPGEAGTLALQYEPVGAIGERGKWIGPKRLAVIGSRFGGQAGPLRVFEAAAGAESLLWSVCEGPLDALAVTTLARLGVCGADPDGAVVGAHGTSGLKSVSPPPGRRAVVWCQGDGPGYAAALQAALRLGAEIETAPKGRDWAEVVSVDRADDVAEREAIADG